MGDILMIYCCVLFHCRFMGLCLLPDRFTELSLCQCRIRNKSSVFLTSLGPQVPGCCRTSMVCCCVSWIWGVCRVCTPCTVVLCCGRNTETHVVTTEVSAFFMTILEVTIGMGIKRLLSQRPASSALSCRRIWKKKQG